RCNQFLWLGRVGEGLGCGLGALGLGWSTVPRRHRELSKRHMHRGSGPVLYNRCRDVHDEGHGWYGRSDVVGEPRHACLPGRGGRMAPRSPPCQPPRGPVQARHPPHTEGAVLMLFMVISTPRPEPPSSMTAKRQAYWQW